jgi:hypothetical protein
MESVPYITTLYMHIFFYETTRRFPSPGYHHPPPHFWVALSSSLQWISTRSQLNRYFGRISAKRKINKVTVLFSYGFCFDFSFHLVFTLNLTRFCGCVFKVFFGYFIQSKVLSLSVFKSFLRIFMFRFIT